METQSIHVLTESNPEHSTPTQLKKKITKTVSFGNDVIFYKYRIPQKHLEGRKR